MSIMAPETLSDVIEDLEDILQAIRLGRDPEDCAYLTISAVDSLVDLSEFYIGTHLSESRSLIALALSLADECAETTKTTDINTARIFEIRQRAEIFH